MAVLSSRRSPRISSGRGPQGWFYDVYRSPSWDPVSCLDINPHTLFTWKGVVGAREITSAVFHWSVERTPKGPRFCYTVSGSQEEQVWRTVRRSGEVPTSFHPTRMPGHNWRITTGRQLNMWQDSADVRSPEGRRCIQQFSSLSFLFLRVLLCVSVRVWVLLILWYLSR